MKNKDQILLEQAYSKILENEDKFQPHDPEMQELSKVGMGEEYPEEHGEKLENEKLNYVQDENHPNIRYSDRTINVRGKDVLVQIEWDSMDDDEWYYLRLVDPETKQKVFHDMSEQDIKNILKDYR